MDLLKHVFALAEEIGPRGTGTPGEVKARKYIFDFLNRNGIKGKEEYFTAQATFSWVYIIFYSIYLVVNILFLKTLNILWLPVIITILVFYILELYTYWGLFSLLTPDRTKTANITCEIDPTGSTEQKILLVAHIDSSKAASYFSPSMVKGFRTTFLLQQAVLFLVPLLILIYSIISLLPLYILICAGFLYVFVTGVLLIVREFFYTHTKGASDNASGVAVLLGLIESLSKESLLKTSVSFLFTGAEETGTYGSLLFSKKYKNSFQNSFIINVDNVGCCKLHYTVSEGVLFSIPVDTNLLRLADEVRSKHSELSITPFSYRTLSTDALPFLIRGYRAMTVIATDDKGIIPNWHWYTDTYDNVNPTTLNEAFKFVDYLIRHIDEQEL